jgi:hypothetical protein
MSDGTTEVTAAPVVQLQIADILLSAQTIQLASSRGAFRAEEFTQIGGLYERLVAFLQASGALQPASEEVAAGPTAE